MWWFVAGFALFLVVALAVDRHRGRPRRLGTGGDPVRDAGYSEDAARTQVNHHQQQSGSGAGG